MSKPKVHSRYLDEAFWGFELARRVARTLESVKFDTIVFTGYSGAVLAPIVACLLDKKMIIVRKGKNERSHSHLDLEGRVDGRRYVFLDDCIESGKTVKRVVRTLLKNPATQHLIPVGYCLWNDADIKPVIVRGRARGAPFTIVMESVGWYQGKISRQAARSRSKKNLKQQIASGGIKVVTHD